MEVELWVKAAVCDTYINHCTINEIQTHEFVAEHNGMVGELYGTLEQIRMQKNEHALNQAQHRLELIEQEINNAFDIGIRLPDPQALNELEINTNPDTFFEVLVNNVRNDILSFQSEFYKRKVKKKNLIRSELKDLKNRVPLDQGMIFIKERELDILTESDLREELARIKNFECLNNEKITLYFMALARNSKTDQQIEDIADENLIIMRNGSPLSQNTLKTFTKM